MDPHILKIFLDEIIRQCEFSEIALVDLRSSLEKLRSSEKRRSVQILKPYILRIFYSAHHFLVCTGNISKLFWPVSKTTKKWPQSINRGEELRNILQVSENSQLKDRTFRNYLEHFDEQIQEWAASSIRKNYLDMSVVPPNQIKGIDIKDIMRYLDPNTLKFMFHGESFDLIATEKEIQKIKERARKAGGN